MLGKNFTSASKDDNVYTPCSITEQLLEHEKFDYDKTVLEPACGKYSMVNILKKYFEENNMNWFDVNNEFLNQDFFIYEPSLYNFSYIITNPPYSQLDKFIIKAKEIATEKFAFLCKLTHLGGIQRFNSGIFRDENYPLTKIYLFTRQANLRFTTEFEEKKGYIPYRKIREDGKYPAGMYYYAWLIWENHNNINYGTEEYCKFTKKLYPTFYWIDNNKYILSKKDFECS